MVIGGEPSEEAVGEMVLAYLDSPEFAEALDRMSRATENTDLGELIEKLEKDRAKLAELGDAFISTDDDTPNMDRAEYKRLSDKLRQRIATNEKRLSSVASVPHVEQAGRGDRLRKAWPRMTFDEKRDVLTSVLTESGKPWAWTIGQRYTSLASLTRADITVTSDLRSH